jgi:hypothetical protein
MSKNLLQFTIYCPKTLLHKVQLLQPLYDVISCLMCAQILGLGYASLLSQDLLSALKIKNIRYLFQSSAQTSMGYVIAQWKDSSDLELSGDLALEWGFFCKDLIGLGIQLQQREDKLIWIGGDNSSILSVKFFYNALAKNLWQHQSGGWRRHMWSWDVVLKIRLFTWLVVENTILTWDNLQKKGWVGPCLCHLCSRDSETVLHLFVNCIFTQHVWQKIKSSLLINSNWARNNLINCYDSWINKERNFNTLPSLTCWFIWLERNKKIFKNGTPSIQAVVYKILGMLEISTSLGPQKGKCLRILKTPCYALPTVVWFDGAAQANGFLSGAGV